MVLVENTHVVSMQMLTDDLVDHKLTFAEIKWETKKIIEKNDRTHK